MILQHLFPNLGGSWAQSSFQCFVTITGGLEPMHHLTVDSVLNLKDYSFRLPVDRFCSSYHKTTRIREAPKKRQTALSIINTLICRLYLLFLLCEWNRTFLTSHRVPWNQFSHATPKILPLAHPFSYTIRILLQRFMTMSSTRVSHYFLLPKHCSSSNIIYWNQIGFPAQHLLLCTILCKTCAGHQDHEQTSQSRGGSCHYKIPWQIKQSNLHGTSAVKHV